MPNKILLVKSIHTAIFFFMSACLLYILYAGITGTYNRALLVAISAIFIEGLVLVINRFQCPLTNLARKYGDEKGTVTDLFYPKWFAPHSFQFSAVLFIIGLVLLLLNYFVW